MHAGPIMEAGRLIAEITKADGAGLARATALRDLEGWDSVKMVRLVVSIEEVLQRELTEDELENLSTVGDVAQLLQKS